VWGSRLDEMVAYRRLNGSSWETYYLLHGGQDTAAKLLDSNGLVVEQYEYDPYGKASVYVGSSTTAVAASSKGLPFLWKSVRLDEITGLLQMRNRYYSTELGRFLTRDPIGVWTDRWNHGNELTYAANRPLVLLDPFGLQGELRSGAQEALQALEHSINHGTTNCCGYNSKEHGPSGDSGGGGGVNVGVLVLEEIFGLAIGAYDCVTDLMAGALGSAALSAAGMLPGVPSGRLLGKICDKAPKGGGGQARFVGQPDGSLVDTSATPRGSYDQPNGGRTDILQREDHGAGHSHTHEPVTNTNPDTGETFINGLEQPGRPVSAADVLNIQSGSATPSPAKGR
jgi:RHS repeat-associated protein